MSVSATSALFSLLWNITEDSHERVHQLQHADDDVSGEASRNPPSPLHKVVRGALQLWSVQCQVHGWVQFCAVLQHAQLDQKAHNPLKICSVRFREVWRCAGPAIGAQNTTPPGLCGPACWRETNKAEDLIWPSLIWAALVIWRSASGVCWRCRVQSLFFSCMSGQCSA